MHERGNEKKMLNAIFWADSAFVWFVWFVWFVYFVVKNYFTRSHVRPMTPLTAMRAPMRE